MALKPVAVECKEREEIKLYGLWARSNVFSWESEWENMMMLYTRKSGDQGKRYVILENTDAKGNCDMFVGGHTPGDGTGEFTVPAGLYASTVVTPKFGFLWGGAMDNASLYLRDEWPKTSGRRLDDFRMEIRDMMGKKPSIEILHRVLPEEPEAAEE